MIAVCTLGCDRKADSLYSWPTLFDLEGDYHLYVNYEFATPEAAVSIGQRVREMDRDCNPRSIPVSLDLWSWDSVYGKPWRKRPQFDQDQARLASIVTARNMCIEFAMQTDATHLLFVDGDIIPPRDIIPKLLEVDKPAVAGMVFGRGCHSSSPYVFGEKRRFSQGNPAYELIEAEHGNIGYTMISRKLFESVRFRWGNSHYPDGRVSNTSDDPAFHLDCFLKWGEWMYIRTDVPGKHVGELSLDAVSQF